MVRRRLLAPLCALVLCLLAAGSAGALPRLSANPADRMLSTPVDAERYDRATRCTNPAAPRPGMRKLTRWLEANSRGASWGSYRCEKWGKRSASLHAENRALDWHLDAAVPAQRREADRLIALLLASDRNGNPRALARRMGVQEIIWNCRIWWPGSDELHPYSECYTKSGKRRKRVNKTLAHRDHVHFGMSWPGARAKTSFWARSR